MGFLTGPREAKAIGTQAFLSGLLNASPNDALYPEPSFSTFVETGFVKSELVYACVMEKATSLPEAPLRVFPADGVGAARDTHRLRQLLENPNPVMTEFELMELLVIHLDLAGNAFWEVVRGRGGQAVELWPLQPNRIRIYPRRNGRHEYGYQLDIGKVIPLGRDVVHFKLPNPADPYVGQPPMRPALRAVALDNEATDFVTSLLQNRAIPGVVIETEAAVDEDVTKRLTAKWFEKFGRNNRGKPAFLQKGMKPHVLGLGLDKLEFPDLRTIAETRICSVFGVPPILVGAKAGLDRSTFANYAEARRSFWEETLMPLQTRIAQTIAKQLLPLVEDGPRPRRINVRFDNSEVLALRESEGDRWEKANQALRAGGITRNDFRRRVGLQPVPGGDVFLSPAGVIVTDASGTPTGDVVPAEQPPVAPGQDDDVKSSTWDLLAPDHPDHMKQCPTCRVVWSSETKANECTEHHYRDISADVAMAERN